MNINEVAQWVIDNRYPKSEFEKLSDHELYHGLIEKIELVLKQNRNTGAETTTVSPALAKLPVSRPLPGSDEDLATEIIARYWQNNGRQGRITKMLKEAFADGAIWMKERLSGNDG